MGGKTAQIGFYYQNLFTVLKILEGLQAGNLLSIKIEQQIKGFGRKEIDIILESENKHFEFYEIKSGQRFGDSPPDIKATIKKFYKIHYRKNNHAIHRYYLIINPEYLPSVLEIKLKLQKIIKRKKGHKRATQQLAAEWHIADWRLLWSLLQETEIRAEITLEKLKKLCNAEIKGIVERLVMNADHGLETSDLLNRLVSCINDCLVNKDGIIDILSFTTHIIEWIARNRLISRIPQQGVDVETVLIKERTFVSERIKSIFPNIESITGVI